MTPSEIFETPEASGFSEIVHESIEEVLQFIEVDGVCAAVIRKDGKLYLNVSGSREYSGEVIDLDKFAQQEVQEAVETERKNWDSISDDDSCECDNCHRRRAYLRDPEKELHKIQQRILSTLKSKQLEDK